MLSPAMLISYSFIAVLSGRPEKTPSVEDSPESVDRNLSPDIFSNRRKTDESRMDAMTERRPEEVHVLFTDAIKSGDLGSPCALYEAAARIVPHPGQTSRLWAALPSVISEKIFHGDAEERFGNKKCYSGRRHHHFCA
jgi:hypothetical protein